MITMTTNEKFIKEVMKGFQNNRGKGSVYCIRPFTPYNLIAECVSSFSNKHIGKQVLIVVDEYNKRVNIINKINELFPNNNFNFKVLNVDYINTNYHYIYDYTIIVGNIDNFILVNKLRMESKFTLFIMTEHIKNQDFVKRVRTILPNIDVSVNKDDVQRELIYSPVEEYWYEVELSDEDREQYDKCTEFINNTIAIFGSLKNIELAKHGDATINLSSSEFRHSLAKQNGWSEELDMKVDYNKMIDANYNPNILFEKACTFYNISNERRNLLLNNKNKIDEVYNICLNNIDKKILILSKNGEFAAAITKHINETYGKDICGDYHDCIEDMIAVDMYNNPILIKSGKDKGKPRVVKSTAISTNNEKRFNSGIINILSAKISSNTKLSINVDIVIFTDGISADITEVKSRFTNSTFNVPTITHRLVTNNSVELKKLLEKNQPANVIIYRTNEKNAIFDEKSGDIIW